MKEEKDRANQIIAAGAALLNCINWTAIPDMQELARAAQKGPFGRRLTFLLKSKFWESEKDELRLLGYPDWVTSRLTPDMDETEPHWSLQHPWLQSGDHQMVLIHHNPNDDQVVTGYEVYDIVKNNGSLIDCVGLQSLIDFQANREKIPESFYGKFVVAWKSVVHEHNLAAPLISLHKVPMMFVSRLAPLEITWLPLNHMWTKDHFIILVPA